MTRLGLSLEAFPRKTLSALALAESFLGQVLPERISVLVCSNQLPERSPSVTDCPIEIVDILVVSVYSQATVAAA